LKNTDDLKSQLNTNNQSNINFKDIVNTQINTNIQKTFYNNFKTLSSKKTNNKLEIIDDNDESSNKTILEDTNMEDVQNNKKQSFTIKSHTECNNDDDSTKTKE
jgi:hypothetical protein